MKQRLYLIFIFLIILTSSVNAYQISTSWQKDVIIEEINGANVINKEGNLESKVFMEFTVTSNYSSHPYLSIHFDPWEHIFNKPIKDISILICDHPGNLGWNYDTGYAEECINHHDYNLSNHTVERCFINDGKCEMMEYTDYKITFFPDRINKNQRFVFLINYTTPNFIFKQGDYNVAWLRFPNMGGIKLINSIILPTKDDIPRFIPITKEIRRDGYWEGKNYYYRWTFIMEEDEDKIIWYLNDEKLKKSKRNTQIFFTILGAFAGLLIILIYERFKNPDSYFCKKCDKTHTVHRTDWKDHLKFRK